MFFIKNHWKFVTEGYFKLQCGLERLIFNYLIKIWLLILFVFAFLFLSMNLNSLGSSISSLVGVIVGGAVTWLTVNKASFEKIKFRAYKTITFLSTEIELFLSTQEPFILNQYEYENSNIKEEISGDIDYMRDDRIAQAQAPDRKFNTYFKDKFTVNSIILYHFCDDYFNTAISYTKTFLDMLKEYHSIVAKSAVIGEAAPELLPHVKKMRITLMKIKNEIKNTPAY